MKKGSLTALAAVAVLAVVATTGEAAPISKVYWTDHQEDPLVGTVDRADLNGASVQNVFTGSDTRPTGLAVDLDGEKVYWTDWVTDTIRRADLNGDNVEDLVTSGLVTPSGIDVDRTGGHMFWGDLGTQSILRADLDGGNVTPLITTGLRGPRDIALNVPAGEMYWTDRAVGDHFVNIWRAELDGSNPQIILTLTDVVAEGISFDPVEEKLYVADWIGNAIRRFDTDGSNAVVFTAALDPQDVAVDPIHRTLYWTEADPLGDDTAGRIRRINLDGSNLVTVVSDLIDPYSVAVPEPATMALLALGTLGLIATRRRR